MPVVTLKEILGGASKGGYAVGMFNMLNLEMARAIIEAAEAERSPVILGVAEVHLSIVPFQYASLVMRGLAEMASVPVCLHFDHGTDKKAIFRALDAGFTSVMYDGSSLSFEENSDNCREVAEYAARTGASLEAELGHVGGSDSEGSGGEALYTDPKQVADFVRLSQADALAVSIGTVHGPYQSVPRLDFELLREINLISSVPLVLHGGSGLSDEDFGRTIQNGVRKVNICTDMLLAAAGTSRGLERYEDMITAATDAVRDTVAGKMRLFGSSGRV